MKSTNEMTGLVDDLAALWTEPILEILKVAGVGRVPVAMELETWRTLRKVLRSELRWQRAFRFSTQVSFGTLMEQVLRTTALSVLRNFSPALTSAAAEIQIRRLVGDRQGTPAERRLYAAMVREPALHAAFKPLSRTDLVPRLHSLSVGG